MRRWLARIGAAGLALALALAVAVPVLVNSAAMRSRVSRVVASIVGFPTVIKSISVGPWSGVTLHEVAIGPGVDEAEAQGIAIPAVGEGVLGARLDEVRIELDWWSLVGDVVRVRRVVLDGVNVRIPAGLLLAAGARGVPEPGPMLALGGGDVVGLPDAEGDAAEREIASAEPPAGEAADEASGRETVDSPLAVADAAAGRNEDGDAPAGTAAAGPSGPPTIPGAGDTGSEGPAQGSSPTAGLSPSRGADGTPRPPDVRRRGRVVSIERVALRASSVVLTDESGAAEFVRVEGVESDVPLVAGDAANRGSGGATIRSVLVPGASAAVLADLSATIAPTAAGLEFEIESGRIAGGNLGGGGAIEFRRPGIPVRLEVELAGADPEGIGFPDAFPAGAVSGDPVLAGLRFEGRVAVPATWSGGGFVRTNRLAVDVSALAQPREGDPGAGPNGAVPEAFRLDLRPAVVEFGIENGMVRVDDVFLHGGDVAFRGRGWSTFDGRLAVTARIYLDESFGRAAERLLLAAFPDKPPGLLPLEPTSLIFRELGISGSVAAPEFHFWLDRPPLSLDALRLLVSQRLSNNGGGGETEPEAVPVPAPQPED